MRRVTRSRKTSLGSPALGRAAGALGILALLAHAVAVSAQTTPQSPALPEYFGVYAVGGGELIKLDAETPQFKRYVDVPLGWRNAVGNILKGEPPAFSATQRVPEVPADVSILAFAPSTGPLTPIVIAGQLKLNSLVYVRHVMADTGWPNNVRRAGAENGWDSAEATELVGMTQGDVAAAIELLLKPYQGRQDMILAVPAKKLSPGVFRLSGPGMKTVTFAVPPVEQGASAKCVDAEYTYTMMMSQSKFRPCTGGGVVAADQAGTGTAPGSSSTTEPGGTSCSAYEMCVAEGRTAFNAKQWTQAIPSFQKAARLEPSKPQPWAAMASIYVATGRYPDAGQMWNKVVETSGEISFDGCLNSFFRCQVGKLRIGPKDVVFTKEDGGTEFSAPLSDVVSGKVERRAAEPSTRLSARSWATFTVKGKGYEFVPTVRFVDCLVRMSTGTYRDSHFGCPEPGPAQQVAVAQYVLDSMTGLREGRLAKLDPTSPTAAGPARARDDSCADYGSCIAAGREALDSRQWSRAVASFEKASQLDPSKPDAWANLGTAHLIVGRSTDARKAWDKALETGTVSFPVRIAKMFGASEASLRLNPAEVSLVKSDGATVFVAPLGEVGKLELKRSNLFGIVDLSLQVRGTSYQLTPRVYGVDCKTLASFQGCPDAGMDQQTARGQYVIDSVNRLRDKKQ